MAKKSKIKIPDHDLGKIQRILNARGITQAELGKVCKWRKSYVSGVCSGEIKIGWVNICKICQFFDVSPDKILPWEAWLEYSRNKRKGKK